MPFIFADMKLIYKKDDINDVAQQCWQLLSSPVIALHGEMGAGKTTLTHALCDAKGVKDVVSSPTFSIINEYQFEENGQSKKIFHIDLYRLKDEEEAVQAGIEDCFYSGHICLVEWPEKTPLLLPDSTQHIYLQVVDAQTRQLTIADK